MATKADFQMTQEMVQDYNKNGYVIIKGLLNSEEVSRLRSAVEDKDGITKYAFGLNDDGRRKARMTLWFQPGDDVTGMVARCDKVATSAETLLGGEAYHYHTKLMMKESRLVDGKRVDGGRHVWHQDYGYWYSNHFLFPDMLTVFIPIDPCTKENGCLQVIPGSHKCGRIDHLFVGGQTGADINRVQQILDYGLDLQFVEMQPGDALFFHCNLLHKSERNDTDDRRWAFLIAYNMVTNIAVKEPEKSRYRPLVKVPNTAILQCPNFVDISGKDFIDIRNTTTVIYEEEDDN